MCETLFFFPFFYIVFAAPLGPDAGDYFVRSRPECSAWPLLAHMPASEPSESARQKTAAESEFKWIRPACDRYWKWISPPVKTNNAFPAQRFAERRPGGVRWMEDSAELPVTRPLLPWPPTSASLLMHIVHAQANALTHMQTHTRR